MTPFRLFGSTALAVALALPAAPGLASMTTNSAVFVTSVPGDAGTLLIDVKQGRSGTGVRGRDRDRDDDDKRRGRGRGSDDGASRSSSGGSHSGRSRARVPGGSGCDSPRDLLEHPECRVMPGRGVGTAGSVGATPPANGLSGSGRDRPRIPGGSGCDDPQDLIEHPECRL